MKRASIYIVIAFVVGLCFAQCGGGGGSSDQDNQPTTLSHQNSAAVNSAVQMSMVAVFESIAAAAGSPSISAGTEKSSEFVCSASGCTCPNGGSLEVSTSGYGCGFSGDVTETVTFHDCQSISCGEAVTLNGTVTATATVNVSCSPIGVTISNGKMSTAGECSGLTATVGGEDIAVGFIAHVGFSFAPSNFSQFSGSMCAGGVSKTFNTVAEFFAAFDSTQGTCGAVAGAEDIFGTGGGGGGAFCGNDTCDSGETAESCPADCSSTGGTCSDGSPSYYFGDEYCSCLADMASAPDCSLWHCQPAGELCEDFLRAFCFHKSFLHQTAPSDAAFYEATPDFMSACRFFYAEGYVPLEGPDCSIDNPEWIESCCDDWWTYAYILGIPCRAPGEPPECAEVTCAIQSSQ
jgi:hypothetical protein